jgi:selenocysteine-specific elongation factor
MALRAAVRVLVEDHHAAHPLEPGAPLQALRGKLAGAAELVESVVAGLVAAGELVLEGGLIRRSGWRPTLTGEEEVLRERLAAAIRNGGREPPSVGELEDTIGAQTGALLRLLERSGSIISVDADRYFDRGVLERLIDDVRGQMTGGREYGPGEMRDIIGVSRKYLIPLLEYCDRAGVTERRTGGRAIIGI